MLGTGGVGSDGGGVGGLACYKSRGNTKGFGGFGGGGGGCVAGGGGGGFTGKPILTLMYSETNTHRFSTKPKMAGYGTITVNSF